MRRENSGNIFIVGCVFLTAAMWFIFPPVPDGRENFERQYAGEIIGSINIVLMAFALLLAARPRWAEPYFGGLDKMYLTHRRLATTALLLIFVHVLTVPITLSGWRLGNYLAVIAFLGLVVIMLVSLAPRIAFLNRLTNGTYEGWKRLKRFIGIFFILGFIHSLTIASPLSALIAFTWVQMFFIMGTLAYLYTEVFGRFFKKQVPYRVEAVKHPNGQVTEVTLRAQGQPIRKQRAGQFLFVRFPGDPALDEAHPFTISSAPQEDVLRLTIKASGDFTRNLFARLKPGQEAIIEGAYGRFDFRMGGPKQVWIAGGIGVTPFLSFLRSLQGDLQQDVDFYYTVRHRDEALFTDEIEAAARANPRLRVFIRCSGSEGSLTVAEIVENLGGAVRDRHVYLCGPLPMLQAFERKFLELGLPAQQIHFEEFSFR